MKMKSKARSRASPCAMSVKGEGETGSAHAAFPKLGLAGRGYLAV